MYPRKHSPSYQDLAITRRGSFCDPVQVVGIGFESTNAPGVEALCENREEGGILEWNSDAMASYYKGIGVQNTTQLALASYLFELVFKLCIAKAENVSESPGFEPCIVYTGGGGRRGK